MSSNELAKAKEALKTGRLFLIMADPAKECTAEDWVQITRLFDKLLSAAAATLPPLPSGEGGSDRYRETHCYACGLDVLPKDTEAHVSGRLHQLMRSYRAGAHQEAL